jgi:CheY-like chemotaxis protein
MDHQSRLPATFATRPRIGFHIDRLMRPGIDRATKAHFQRRPEDDATELLPLPRADEGVRRRPLILVADDDDFIRRLLETVLQLTGFDMVSASTGHEALNRFLRHPRAIQAALLDVSLPGWSGPQTLAALRRFDPGLPCCFMTGDPTPYTEAQLLTAGAARVFWKPLVVGEVATTLRRLTGQTWPST